MKKILKFIAFFATIFLYSCTAEISREEVIGDYRVEYSYAVEYLQLRKDGTYNQKILVNDDPAVREKNGAWHYSKNKCIEVILENAMIIDDGFGRPTKEFWVGSNGLSIFCASKIFNSVSLAINEDLDFSYKKLR